MTYKKFIRNIDHAFEKYEWWQTFFFLIGILAILSIIGALFFSVGSTPREFYTSGSVPSVTEPQFPLALAHTVNAALEEGGTIEILENGDGFFPALLRSLEGAKQTINFSVYIWEDGQVSTDILNTMIRKQKEGVKVRVLLDSIGSKKAPDELFEELRAAGGTVEKYRPLKFGKLMRYYRRNHRRSIVVDGREGFTGGMAVSDSWLGNAEDKDHWRDIMFKVTGPMARSLQDAFADHWAGSEGELLLGDDIYPETFPASEESGIKFVHIAGSPADDSQPMPKFLLLPLLAAKERLYIATPYFVANKDLTNALKSQAESGVDVRLLLPGKYIDNKTSRWGAQNYYEDLMESGVRIYEYRPTFMHSKFIIVDGALSVIGSPNLNSRSRQLDEENAMAVLDAALAADLEDIFNADLAQSEEINLDTWRGRNPFLRTLQLFSRLIAQQS